MNRVFKVSSFGLVAVALLLTVAAPTTYAASQPASGGTLACKAVGQACVNPGDCCSHHCKNFSAGFYCYKTEQGIE
jgi:hypothetical protein